MYSRAGIGIERHGLILITDLEHRVLNGSIVEAERNLFKVAPPASSIAVVQIRIHSVVPDDGCECGTFAKSFGGPSCQEIRHEMVIPLDVISTHALGRNAWAAVSTDTC